MDVSLDLNQAVLRLIPVFYTAAGGGGMAGREEFHSGDL